MTHFQKGGLDWSQPARIEGAPSDRAHSASDKDHSGYPFHHFSASCSCREGHLTLVLIRLVRMISWTSVTLRYSIS